MSDNLFRNQFSKIKKASHFAVRSLLFKLIKHYGVGAIAIAAVSDASK